MKRNVSLYIPLVLLLAASCSPRREPHSPKPLTADGSGPSYSGPGTPWHDPDSNAKDSAPIEQLERRAQATFIAAPGYSLQGSAQLSEVREGVKVHVEITGAPPGEKGIHVHQTADCSDIPNKSMGKHFAPEGNAHGMPAAMHHHLGDLGNITIDQQGKGSLEIIVKDANLKEQDNYSFVTRSIVIHESNDKGTGESGDSGKPIACAPIQS